MFVKIAGLSLLLGAQVQASKLLVDRERLINLSAKGDVWKLFDEQGTLDPKAGIKSVPVTEYTNGWIGKVLYYPIEGIVDLGVEHDLTDVWFYDISGSDSLSVACGDGLVWKNMVWETTSGYLAWVGRAATCTGRYVKIRLKSPSTSITEMVLYGTAKGAVQPLPVATAHPKPTMGQLMGVNGFIDDDRALLAVTDNLREYHESQWDDGNGDPLTPAYPDNRFGWNPSWVRGTGWGWNFDDFYGSLSAQGMVINPVLQGSPAWRFGMAVGAELKPIASGADSTLPQTYLAHADQMYQYAARYGRTQVAAANLRVDALNTAKSGLGFVKYLEGWNEPDKDWKGVTGYFSPSVLAAMSSADYDGDQGRMGMHVGVKNADPSMKVTLPGLIGIRTEYIRAIKFWADRHRNGSFPADVLNFHHYCTDGGKQDTVSTTGISPEQDGLLERLREVAAYRDRYLPAQELWLSEFGWDTQSGSPYRAHAVAGHDELEMQGRWLVRGFLALAASGFDKGHIFMLRDDWDVSPGIFATSGLVHDKDATNFPVYQKKPSWDYVNTFHKTLRNYRFEADESKGEMHLFRFAHASQSDSVAYVAWNQNDSAVASSVTISGLGSGRIVRLVAGQPLGVPSSAAVVAGGLNLADVEGRPVLVVGRRGTTAIGAAVSVSASSRLGVRANGSRVKAGQRGRLEPLYRQNP